MIAPNMATMLCFITTDCAISAALLRRALRETVGKTFNRITVDGDCSTNDTVAVLASAAAGNPLIARTGPGFRAFRDGLLAVAEELSQAVVRDGEGASRFVEISVTGARSESEAARVARSIADQPAGQVRHQRRRPELGTDHLRRRLFRRRGRAGTDAPVDQRADAVPQRHAGGRPAGETRRLHEAEGDSRAPRPRPRPAPRAGSGRATFRKNTSPSTRTTIPEMKPLEQPDQTRLARREEVRPG